MSQSGIPPVKNVSLDELVALNDEIASLVRAGVPLERGLINLGSDLPGRLGRLATRIGKQMEGGASLSQAVSQNDAEFPRVYQAVVEAGVKGGRLSFALERLSETTRRAAAMRRLTGVSLIYPLALLGGAYAMFVFSVAYWLPRIVAAHREMGLSAGSWLDALVTLGHWAAWWAPWPPVLAGLLLLGVWVRSGRFSVWGDRSPFRGWPTLGRMFETGRLAAFADILGVLIEQELPLDEALVLAADASGGRGLRASSRKLAERIRAGGTIDVAQFHGTSFPPTVAWLLAGGSSPSELAKSLAHTAERYRTQARRTGDWLTVYLPIVLAAGLGGTSVVTLAVMTLGPWYHLLFELAKR